MSSEKRALRLWLTDMLAAAVICRLYANPWSGYWRTCLDEDYPRPERNRDPNPNYYPCHRQQLDELGGARTLDSRGKK